MPNPALSLRLTGAQVLRDGALQSRTLVIDKGRITKGPLPEIDLTGYLLLPGIIDMHGDAFERHISPRPSAPFPLEMGLASTDRDAATNGVTTAWLAQSWSWEGGHRSPDFAEQILNAVEEHRAHALTDLHVQIRCETNTVDTYERLIAAIKRHRVGYVVFNNHLEEALQMARLKPEEVTNCAQRAGRSAQDHLECLREAFHQEDRVPRYLCTLAEQFDALGVRYGSHDDPDGDTREKYSLIGAQICEFPTARSAAALAKAVNDPVIMGAPNVVRGGSQAGNIAAESLIADGLCDVLVSDYHYPSLARAAFKLDRAGVLPLAKAWNMISANPANIMGMADRGSLEPGKRADIVIVNANTQSIEGTICNGRISHMSGDAAHRFYGVPTNTKMAAE